MVIGVVIGVVAGLAVGLAFHLARQTKLTSDARTAEGRLVDAQAAVAQLTAQVQEATEARSAAESAGASSTRRR